jgi:NAD(P)-dependent dehydrogenase (short-subunit alcohol dehydrogenase family)
MPLAMAAEHSSGPAAPGPAARQPAGRAIVVGASSGIGAALARALLSQGWRVAALARRGEELERLRAQGAPGALLARVHDVRETRAVPALFEELVRELGGLELLIYAAGIMPRVGPEEYDTAKDLDILAVNTAGAIAWCNPAAEFFQSRRAGTIVGIGSIAGDRGRKGNPVYGASKAALAHYLEALRNRLGPCGVHVCTVKPGYVETVMTRELEKPFWMISADEAARQILSLARRRKNVRYVPWRWLWVSLAVRSIPSFLFQRLNV